MWLQEELEQGPAGGDGEGEEEFIPNDVPAYASDNRLNNPATLAQYAQQPGMWEVLPPALNGGQGPLAGAGSLGGAPAVGQGPGAGRPPGPAQGLGDGDPQDGEYDIDAALEELEVQDEALKRQQARAARGAEVPTEEMYRECQELLQMFGLPYIVAPVEVRTGPEESSGATCSATCSAG